MKLPLGFSFAGVAAGIKVKRHDLALILSEVPAVAAGCFTRSRTRAPSVDWCAARLPRDDARAIVASSGNANAMAGPTGEADNATVARSIARILDVGEDTVMTAATGVVGVPFPVAKVTAAAERLVAALEPDPRNAAEALLTTDTVTKIAEREIFVGGARVRLLGLAKGSGMVHPDMATVLCFLVTDAAVSSSFLDAALRASVDETFNMLSVDRDTSTNDSVIALANGLAKNARVDDLTSEAGAHFAAALTEVCSELARAVARDGEGARRLITARATGAGSREAARGFARSIVESNLVKAALFGSDPACGRVVAALGARASLLSVPLEAAELSVRMQGVTVFDHGAPAPFDADALRSRLRQDEVRVEVCVGTGPFEATAWGCDLSYDYVRINADYAAVVTDGPGGAVRRDGRLDIKTPELKAEVLVSALGYIERFSGTRAVIAYGEPTLGRRDLAVRLASDVRLLAAVGLRPILVQGQSSTEVVVGALASAGVRAIGLSGADGNLIRMEHRGMGPPTLSIDPDVIETLLAKGYIPIVMPSLTEVDGLGAGVGREGIGAVPRDRPSMRGLPVSSDVVAAEIAVACRAKKLIYLGDSPGLLTEGLLVSEISPEELDRRRHDQTLDGISAARAESAVRAIAGGVESVHLIDERVPHNVVAELFTDRGVGTMVR